MCGNKETVFVLLQQYLLTHSSSRWNVSICNISWCLLQCIVITLKFSNTKSLPIPTDIAWIRKHGRKRNRLHRPALSHRAPFSRFRRALYFSINFGPLLRHSWRALRALKPVDVGLVGPTTVRYGTSEDQKNPLHASPEENFSGYNAKNATLAYNSHANTQGIINIFCRCCSFVPERKQPSLNKNHFTSFWRWAQVQDDDSSGILNGK